VLEAVASWDVPNAAAAVVDADGTVIDRWGDTSRPFRLASITKMLTGWTAMVAVEEGTVTLDDPVGQPGCTLRHVLAHAGGYPFDGTDPITAPERSRIYSNSGIEVAAEHIAVASSMPFSDYLTAAVIEPLGMASATMNGSPAHGARASVDDLVAFVAELQRPQLISPESAIEAVSIQYPSLSGIVPGVGRFAPCPWGLGIEIRGDKSPHWTGTDNSPATFGHFGGAGTMLWVDPRAGRSLIALTDRRFDDWPEAVASWRSLSDTVLSAA
jgi:CubicO group peptidase (beta-lactamase class C family)